MNERAKGFLNYNTKNKFSQKSNRLIKNPHEKYERGRFDEPKDIPFTPTPNATGKLQARRKRVGKFGAPYRKGRDGGILSLFGPSSLPFQTQISFMSSGDRSEFSFYSKNGTGPNRRKKRAPYRKGRGGGILNHFPSFWAITFAISNLFSFPSYTYSPSLWYDYCWKGQGHNQVLALKGATPKRCSASPIWIRENCKEGFSVSH